MSNTLIHVSTIQVALVQSTYAHSEQIAHYVYHQSHSSQYHSHVNWSSVHLRTHIINVTSTIIGTQPSFHQAQI